MENSSNNPEQKGGQVGETQGSASVNLPSSSLAGKQGKEDLVPVTPARKRTKTLSEVGKQGSFAAIDAQGTDPQLRERKSAPEKTERRDRELRGSKSAPDLRLPALAAIRSLQAGNLKLDSHLRNKIAAAAKRVLAARELKRRASQDLLQQINASVPVHDPSQPLMESQPNVPHESSKLSYSLSAPTEAGTSPSARSSVQPRSLATAAAIAAGLPVPLAANRASLRPQSSEVPHHPFTITTGVPRFAQDLGAQSARASPANAPATPNDCANEKREST